MLNWIAYVNLQIFSVEIIRFLRRSKVLRITVRNANEANFDIDENILDEGPAAYMAVRIENRWASV